MAVPVTITLQIDHFDGCLYTVKKAVNKALGKLNNTKLLEIYPDTRSLTISTVEHPEVVKHVLKDVFPKNNIIIMPQKINQPSPVSMPRVNKIVKPVVIITQDGSVSVEYMQSTDVSLFSINCSNCKYRPTPPWLAPALYHAPHNHTIFDQIYGSVPKASDQGYGHAPTTRDQGYEHAPTTRDDQSYGYAPTTRDQGCGHAPTTRDQGYEHAPTTQDQVYGYPPEYYGVHNHPHELCTIL